MKKIIIAFSCFFTMSLISAQTVDEIVAKHIEARGGAEKISKLNSCIMDATMNANGMEIGVTITKVHNKLVRQDITINGISNFVLITDTAGWTYMPIGGQTKPEAMPMELVKKSATELDIQDPLLQYKEKGFSLELVGKEDVEGTECYKLKLSKNDLDDQTIYVDPTSNLIIRIKRKVSANGQEQEASTDFSDYKDVDGIKMPYSISSAYGPVIIKTIKLNEAVNEKMYKPETVK